jgi:hypothetical protein
LLVVAACAIALGFAVPAQAATSGLTWSGAGAVRLGGALGPGARTACGSHVLSSRDLEMDDLGGRPGRVSDIHTVARGVHGPLGVRVGMSDAALRRALGRHSSGFTASRRPGRLLVGHSHHTLWAVETGTRSRAVAEFGIALSKAVALRAAKATPCPPAPAPTPVPPAPGPSSPAGDQAASSAPADPGTSTGTTTTPTTPAQCPATLPTVGPFMRVACDDSTGNQVQYTCHPDWRDLNLDPADGCESEKDGLQTMWFTNSSLQALSDHLLGSFSMDGYGYPIDPATNGPAPGWPETGWGYYSEGGQSSIPITVAPDCASNPAVDCPGGQPAANGSSLTLDLTQRAGDAPRTYAAMSGTAVSTGSDFAGAGAGTTQATVGARFRLTTTTPIQITKSNATCNVSIDTTQGTIPDVTLATTLSRATDPDTGQGDDGPPQPTNVTLSNLQATDYTVSPATQNDFLCFGSSFIAQQDVVAAIQPALMDWFEGRTRLCGTAGPHWWEPCPASVDVSW